MQVPIRKLNVLSMLVCLALITVSFYMQYAMHMVPCLLCLLQRDLIIFLAIIFGLGTVISLNATWRSSIYGIIISLVSMLGLLISGRHIWLQTHPSSTEYAACLPNLSYMFQYFSLKKTADLVLQGSGECSKIHWHFMGLSLPVWLFGFFLLFLMIGLYYLFLKPQTARTH